MNDARIEIRLGPTGKDCDIWIDGVHQENVARLVLTIDTDELTRLNITYVGVRGSGSGIVETTGLGAEWRTFEKSESAAETGEGGTFRCPVCDVAMDIKIGMGNKCERCGHTVYRKGNGQVAVLW